jgi:hypothetical protein
MLARVCHCGHDESSHHYDMTVQPAVRAGCLARGCDCALYAHVSGPKPKPPPPVKPEHPSHCRCTRCVAWRTYQIGA